MLIINLNSKETKKEEKEEKNNIEENNKLENFQEVTQINEEDEKKEKLFSKPQNLIKPINEENINQVLSVEKNENKKEEEKKSIFNSLDTNNKKLSLFSNNIFDTKNSKDMKENEKEIKEDKNKKENNNNMNEVNKNLEEDSDNKELENNKEKEPQNNNIFNNNLFNNKNNVQSNSLFSNDFKKNTSLFSSKNEIKNDFASLFNNFTTNDKTNNSDKDTSNKLGLFSSSSPNFQFFSGDNNQSKEKNKTKENISLFGNLFNMKNDKEQENNNIFKIDENNSLFSQTKKEGNLFGNNASNMFGGNQENKIFNIKNENQNNFPELFPKTDNNENKETQKEEINIFGNDSKNQDLDEKNDDSKRILLDDDDNEKEEYNNNIFINNENNEINISFKHFINNNSNKFISKESDIEEEEEEIEEENSEKEDIISNNFIQNKIIYDNKVISNPKINLKDIDSVISEESEEQILIKQYEIKDINNENDKHISKRKPISRKMYNNLISQIIQLIKAKSDRINKEPKKSFNRYNEIIEDNLDNFEFNLQQMKNGYIYALVKKHYCENKNKKKKILIQENIPQKRNNVKKSYYELILLIENKLKNYEENMKYYYEKILELLEKYEEITNEDLNNAKLLYKEKNLDSLKIFKNVIKDKEYEIENGYELQNTDWINQKQAKISTHIKLFFYLSFLVFAIVFIYHFSKY